MLIRKSSYDSVPNDQVNYVITNSPDAESFESLQVICYPEGNFTGTVVFALGDTGITKTVAYSNEKKVASFIAGSDSAFTFFPATMASLIESDNTTHGQDMIMTATIKNTGSVDVSFHTHFLRRIDMR